MKLAVIVSEFGAAVSVGGDVERKVKLFDLSPEIMEYVAKNKGQWTNVCLALSDEEAGETQ